MSDAVNKFVGDPFALVDAVQYAPDAVVSKTLLDKKQGTLTAFAFDKGQGLSEHTAPFDVAVLILDGQARVTIGQDVHHVKNGDLLIMPAQVPHSLTAEEPFKMLLVMIRQKKKS
jgi:quercetin dioxygenase-like cupin family protein